MALIDTSEKIFIRQSNDRQFEELNRDTSAAASGVITPPSIPIPQYQGNNLFVEKLTDPEIIAKKEDYNIIDRLNDLSNRVAALEAKKSLFRQLLSYLGVKGNE